MKSFEFKKDKADKFLVIALKAKKIHVPDGFSSAVLDRIRDEKIHKTLVKAIWTERIIFLSGLGILIVLTILLLHSGLGAGSSSQIQEFLLVSLLFVSKVGANLVIFLGLGSVLIYIVYVLVDLLLVE